MNVLLIGSGGREHALAWKLAQSPLLRQLYILPGNPGTAQLGQNLACSPDDTREVIALSRRHAIDLVVIGPEAPLADGLADDLRQAGLSVFGPDKAAAQIEASKAFSKAFMQRHAIPTAYSRVFIRFDAALKYLRNELNEGRDIKTFVIKASGLAAGKGVFLPHSLEEAEQILRSMLVDGSLSAAGRQVIIEERLRGREVSVLAFTDGISILPMPPVQDHKRLQDYDSGPNTGGMGTFAPSPYCPPDLLEQITQTILRPTIHNLRSEGAPFVGVLYAGLMLTEHGPSVLEYNCRFGDPETQVILPLLETDLLPVLTSCANGTLAQDTPAVSWKDGAAVCVILAAPGYPDKPKTGQTVKGVENLPSGTLAFQAGTKLRGGTLITNGGRVLGITSTGPTLEDAARAAYTAVECIHFEGMQYRKDIGLNQPRPKPPVSTKSHQTSAYEAAGVSIAAGNRAVSLMRKAVRSTFNPHVLSDVGAFGGLYHANQFKLMNDPVLVASTDGIGTKVSLAAGVDGRLSPGSFRSLGQDIVNHCINDILVQGASPLFFLDYIASARLDPELVADLVTGMSTACRAAGCVLLGGETAEMPGVYADDHFDVAGTIVGVVERDQILPRANIQPGDVLLGLPSSGAHTNGYSLIRKVFKNVSLDYIYPELSIPLSEVLLTPHRSYLPWLWPVLKGNRIHPSPVKALAHITGGGFFDNIPRVLPPGTGALIDRATWKVPPLFRLIERLGDINEAEMYQVFNMGIGMVVVLAKEDVKTVQQAIPDESWVIGEVIAAEGVHLDGTNLN